MQTGYQQPDLLDTINEKLQSQTDGGCFLSHGVLTFQGCQMKTTT